MDKSVKESLFKGGMWVIICKLLALFSGIAFSAIMARILSPADLGVYYLVFSVVNLLVLMSLFGMHRSIVRFISESIATGSRGRAQKAISKSMHIAWISSLAVALLIFLGGGEYVAEKIFRLHLKESIIFYPAILVITITFQSLIVQAFRGLNDIKHASIYNGLIINVISVFTLFLLYKIYSRVSLSVAFIVVIIAYVTNALLALFKLEIAKSKLICSNEGVLRYSDLLRASWPIYISTILLAATEQCHIWILGYFRNADSVAIYVSAFRILIILTAILDIVRLVIPPLVGDLYARERYKDVEQLLRSTTTFAALAATVSFALIVLYGKSLLTILYGSYYASGYATLTILSIAHFLNAFTGTPSILLIMASKEKYLAAIAAISNVISITISIKLVTSFDYNGVAVASATGIIMQNILMAGYAYKALSIKTVFKPGDIAKVPYAIKASYIFAKKNMATWH